MRTFLFHFRHADLKQNALSCRSCAVTLRMWSILWPHLSGTSGIIRTMRWTDVLRKWLGLRIASSYIYRRCNRNCSIWRNISSCCKRQSRINRIHSRWPRHALKLVPIARVWSCASKFPQKSFKCIN